MPSNAESVKCLKIKEYLTDVICHCFPQIEVPCSTPRCLWSQFGNQDRTRYSWFLALHGFHSLLTCWLLLVPILPFWKLYLYVLVCTRLFGHYQTISVTISASLPPTIFPSFLPFHPSFLPSFPPTLPPSLPLSFSSFLPLSLRASLPPFLPFLKIYLKIRVPEKEREREREKSFFHCLTPQMTGSGACWSQGLGTLAKYPMCIPRLLGQPSTVCHGSLGSSSFWSYSVPLQSHRQPCHPGGMAW